MGAIATVFASVPVASEAGVTISIPASNKPWQFDNVLFYVGIPNMSEYLTLFSPTQHRICRQWASMLVVNDALAYELAYYSCNDFSLPNT